MNKTITNIVIDKVIADKLTRVFIGIEDNHPVYSQLAYITTHDGCDWYKMENGHPVQQTRAGRIRLVSSNYLPKEVYSKFFP